MRGIEALAGQTCYILVSVRVSVLKESNLNSSYLNFQNHH